MKESTVMYKKHKSFLPKRLCYESLPEKYKVKISQLVFVTVFLLALLPADAVLYIWFICTSMFGPLIVAVLPGLFFYHTRNQKEE